MHDFWVVPSLLRVAILIILSGGESVLDPDGAAWRNPVNLGGQLVPEVWSPASDPAQRAVTVMKGPP